MRKRLTDSVSRDEMLKMRESGMTNEDIARSLDVTRQTVYRYIGCQPGRALRRIYIPEPAKAAPKSSGGVAA